MNVVRWEYAPAYTAPGHESMKLRRLQGREAGPSDSVWIGASVIAPGGGTTLVAADVEKFYVVLSGVVDIEAVEGESRVLERLEVGDSCRVAPQESRRLHNSGTLECRVLLVMPVTP